MRDRERKIIIWKHLGILAQKWRLRPFSIFIHCSHTSLQCSLLFILLYQPHELLLLVPTFPRTTFTTSPQKHAWAYPVSLFICRYRELWWYEGDNDNNSASSPVGKSKSCCAYYLKNNLSLGCTALYSSVATAVEEDLSLFISFGSQNGEWPKPSVLTTEHKQLMLLWV